jgi:hypothetical protein
MRHRSGGHYQFFTATGSLHHFENLTGQAVLPLERPAHFLRHLGSLAPDIPDNYLGILWTSRLPTNIRTILAGMPGVELDAAALCADRIIETVSPSTVASISPGTDYTKLLQIIRDLSRQLANLAAERNRSDSKDLRSRSSNHRSNSRSSSTHRSPSRHDTANTYCWYHYRFGARAQNCTQPCAFHQQKKLEQTSAAAHVCTADTGRLFITDRTSKRQVVIDTGSDLCVFPRKLIPQRKSRVNYDLCAANGSPALNSRTLTLVPTLCYYFLFSVFHNKFLATDPEARFRFPALLKKVVGLERGPLSIVSTTEELLDRKAAAPV